MLKLKSILLLVLITAGVGAFAQSQWEAGYVVLNNGDTLHGQIKDRNDKNNALKVLYRNGKKQKPTVYTTNDLKGYEITASGKIYYNITVPNDSAPPVKRFVQLMIKGEATFYYYRDTTDGARYFLQVKNGELRELRELKYQVANIDRGPGGLESPYVSRVEKKYLGVMKAGFIDCNKLVMDKNFDNTSLSMGPLAKKVVAYNRCVAANTPQYIASRLYRSGAVEFGVVAGVALTTVRLATGFDGQPQPKMRTGYSLGIVSNFFLPALNRSLSLQVEAGFNEKGSRSATDITSWDIHFFDGSFLFKYNYPFGVVRPFVGVGALWGYSLSGIKIDYHTYKDGPVASPEAGLTGELGIKVAMGNNRLLCYAKYDYTHITTLDPRVANNGLSSLQFRVGYVRLIEFKRKL